MRRCVDACVAAWTVDKVRQQTASAGHKCPGLQAAVRGITCAGLWVRIGAVPDGAAAVTVARLQTKLELGLELELELVAIPDGL